VLWLVAKSLFLVKKRELNYVAPRANIMFYTKNESQRLLSSRSSAMAFGTQVRGFVPGRSLRIFRAKKILSTPSFRREVNPSVPCNVEIGI
jgi:hypothetical protein